MLTSLEFVGHGHVNGFWLVYRVMSVFCLSPLVVFRSGDFYVFVSFVGSSRVTIGGSGSFIGYWSGSNEGFPLWLVVVFGLRCFIAFARRSAVGFFLHFLKV